LDFFTFGFWMWVIKVSVPSLSVLLIIFAISPGLCFGLGRLFVTIDNTYLLKRNKLLSASDPVDRISAKWLFAMVDNRLIVGWIGGIGLMISLIYATS
jgi:hypothetical protein